MAIEWITVKHDKTGHEHRIPNRKHVLADWQRRGWRPVNAAKATASKES